METRPRVWLHLLSRGLKSDWQCAHIAALCLVTPSAAKNLLPWEKPKPPSSVVLKSSQCWRRAAVHLYKDAQQKLPGFLRSSLEGRCYVFSENWVTDLLLKKCLGLFTFHLFSSSSCDLNCLLLPTGPYSAGDHLPLTLSVKLDSVKCILFARLYRCTQMVDSLIYQGLKSLLVFKIKILGVELYLFFKHGIIKGSES